MTIDEAKIKIEELACYARTKGWNDEYTEAVNMAIKALEQEPCEDAISRQAAIELFAKNADAVRPYSKTWEEVKALPPVTPQPNKWIPVSERLPEVGSEVLVCYEFKKKRYVYIADFYGDGKFHGLDDEYLTTEGRKYRKAVAWMPLPTPPNKSEIPTGAEGSEE